MPRTGLLFVCMGNICRSPIAEGVFLHLIKSRGLAERFRVDSAGTGGWHAGEPPDHRALAVARRHGIALPSLARQVITEDATRFDHLVCMDRMNRAHLLQQGVPASKVSLLLEHAPELGVSEVPDPYYGGEEGFEQIFALITQGCEGLLRTLGHPSRA